MNSTNRELLGSNTGSHDPQEPQHSTLHMVRARVDSDGSTRGAFYHHGAGRIATTGNNTNATTSRRRRQRRKKGHTQSLPALDVTLGNQTSLDMGGMEIGRAHV